MYKFINRNGININNKNNKNKTPFDLIKKDEDKEKYRNLIKYMRKKMLFMICNKTELIDDICLIITDYTLLQIIEK